VPLVIAVGSRWRILESCRLRRAPARIRRRIAAVRGRRVRPECGPLDADQSQRGNVLAVASVRAGTVAADSLLVNNGMSAPLGVILATDAPGQQHKIIERALSKRTTRPALPQRSRPGEPPGIDRGQYLRRQRGGTAHNGSGSAAKRRMIPVPGARSGSTGCSELQCDSMTSLFYNESRKNYR